MKRECHVRFCESGGVRLPSATRLLGRVPPAEQDLHLGPQPGAGPQARRSTGTPFLDVGTLLGLHSPVAASERRSTATPRKHRPSPAIARELPADSARRPAHGAGNCPHREPLLQQELDVSSFIDAKMLIVRTHANTLTSSMCCTSV
jgi:hypothetical protein